mgnify:CR=1 FL=1
MKLSYFLSKLLKKIQVAAIKNSTIDPTSKVCSQSHVVDSYMERYSYVGNNCTVNFTSIGMFCSIADNVIIGGDSHPITWGSTSPVFHKGKNILKVNFSNHSFKSTKRTIIKNDVWIGSNALIKSGVVIGNGAVVGMGSVVTKDIGDYEIWGGNPAKLIRKRFDDVTISELLKYEWWKLDVSQLSHIAVNINEIESFTKKVLK